MEVTISNGGGAYLNQLPTLNLRSIRMYLKL